MRNLLVALGCLGAVLTAGPSIAQHKQMGGKMAMAGKIAVENVWARASASRTGAGAAYLTLRNTGGSGDRLVSAATKVAKRVELHTHKMENNVMRMARVDGIDLPAGGAVTLKPGGLHVMLMGLNQKLVKGDSFPLTLTFEKSGSVTVDVAVQSIAAMGPSGHGGMKMDHKMK